MGRGRFLATLAVGLFSSVGAASALTLTSPDANPEQQSQMNRSSIVLAAPAITYRQR